MIDGDKRARNQCFSGISVGQEVPNAISKADWHDCRDFRFAVSITAGGFCYPADMHVDMCAVLFS